MGKNWSLSGVDFCFAKIGILAICLPIRRIEPGELPGVGQGHGGRQLDGAIASISALPQLELFRREIDRALALGGWDGVAKLDPSIFFGVPKV
jgi:hypothetical protein